MIKQKHKDKFSRSAFICCIITLLLHWFLKLYGFTHFALDLENPFFTDLNNFISRYNLTNIYYTLTLSFQVYLLYQIVNRSKSKKCLPYILILIPFNVLVRWLTSLYEVELGNVAAVIEIIYLILVTAKFKLKKIPRALFVILFLTVYQALSLFIRDLELQAHTHGFMASQILSIDLYILLFLHREVSLMNDGTWIFFGPTKWLYTVIGFIIGVFTFKNPIKKAKEWAAKAEAKENARKAKRASKRHPLN